MRPLPSRALAAAAASLAALLLAAGCTTVPADRDYTPSFHLQANAATRIAQQLTAALPAGAGAGAARLLSSGFDAWEDRLRLTQLADQSLDLQYFSWDVDESGLVLLSHVIDAAERGVRVRLLLDDMMAIQHDVLAKVDAHDNIEVRLFNPFSTQRMHVLIRPFEWLVKDRLNVRMHNKLFIADGLVGIAGGRNIENRYFWLDRTLNHRDLDALVVGTAVPAMQASFDAYWNSPWAVPLSQLERPAEARQARRYYEALRSYRDRSEVTALLRSAGLGPLERYRVDHDLQPARVEYIADPPTKVVDRQPRQFARLDRLARRIAHQRLLIGMAYLVPTDAVLQQARVLLERGVTLSVLTNSMASIDFPAAFSGYAAARRDLLDMGIALYEYAPDARYDDCGANCAATHMSFHSKYVVIDDAISYIGTMNYDPRSIDLNTEAGLVIYDPQLTAQVAEVFFADAGTRNSWQVGHASPVRWSRPLPDGTREVRAREPDANLLQKLEVGIWRLMPLADEY